MKKTLSGLVAASFVALSAFAGSQVELAKKAGGEKSPARQAVTSIAKARTAVDGKGFHMLGAKKGNKNFRNALKGKVEPTKQAPQFAGGMPNLMGSVIYSEAEDFDPGVYEIPTSQGPTELVFAGPNASYGGVKVGNTYYTVDYQTFFGMLLAYDIKGYDLTSEEVVYSKDMKSGQDVRFLCPGGMVYDESTSTIFGIGFQTGGNSLQLAKFVYGDTPSVTQVGALEGNWNSLMIDASGQLYGIRYWGETQDDNYVVLGSALCKINKLTGEVTEVGECGVAPQYLSSATIDTKTGRCFWNVNPADDSSWMYEVNLTTGVATKLYSITTGDEVMGMFVGSSPNGNAPAGVSDVAVNFPQDNLTGTVTLKAPATLFDGSAASGNVTLKVKANGTEVGTATAAYGANATVNVTVSTAGSYTFEVYASNANGDGPVAKVKNFWVGADTPEATVATLVYANGNMELTWNAVTGSVNGGYIDQAGLTYTVTRYTNGTAQEVASGLTTTTFTEAIAVPADITSYYYTVVAVAGTLSSAPAKSNVVTLGSIVPPYVANPAQDGLAGYTVIDGNGDNKVWTVDGDKFKISYTANGVNMDDWLISPPMKLEYGKAYKVNFNVWNNSTTYKERIEVKYGKAATAEGMTGTLLEPTEVTNKEAGMVSVSEFIVPDETGIYYVGFHGISDPNQYFLYVGGFEVEAGVSALAPGAATNLTVTPDASGALAATVAFNAPSTTMHGQALSSLTKVELSRDGNVVKTFTAPAVGSALSFNDNTITEGGDVTYTVVGYNAEGTGVAASASAFIGFQAPASPANVAIARTATTGSVSVTWDAVTTDIGGKAFPAGSVKYMVVDYSNPSNPETLVSDFAGTTYTFQAVPEGEQDFVQCAVFAVYNGTQGQGTLSDMIPVGTPYEGLNESFANKTLSYIWGYRAIGTSGTQGVSLQGDDFQPSQDGDNGILALKGQYLDEGIALFSGMVSTNQLVNPALSFYTFNIVGDDPTKPDINEISVGVKKASDTEYTTVMAATPINQLANGVEGWCKVTVPLTGYENEVIQFQITAITKQFVYTTLDNIKVGSMLSHDLKAKNIVAPANVPAGRDYAVTVEVSNEGFETAQNYSVELYANEDLYDTQTCASLAASATEFVQFECTMSALAEESVTYFAKVVYAQDENVGNNQTSSITVTPVVSTLPKVSDLEAENIDEGVKLTWSAPDLSENSPMMAPAAITEDFEDGDAFSNEYGEWTFIDGDQSPVGGFQGLDPPGITAGTTMGSFWIWDTEWSNANAGQTAASFGAHSGSKYLFALFRYDDGTTDDYAISPELYTGGQTISFYARSYSGQYPEKIEVLYSTSGKEISDFTGNVAMAPVVPSSGGSDRTYTLYTANLPAGAKYFAIHSFATGSFMLLVDDVTYIPAPLGALEVAGYNVFRDGVKINNELVTDTEYVDTNVTEGEQYTYVVTTVYADNRGESAGSNEAVITSTGGSGVNVLNGAVSVVVENGNIVVLNAVGEKVVVVATDGKTEYAGVASEAKTVIPVTKGVYVVKAANVIRKVIVK